MSRSPLFLKLQESWAKSRQESWPQCLPWPFLLTVVGQMVKTPPPLAWKVPHYISAFNDLSFTVKWSSTVVAHEAITIDLLRNCKSDPTHFLSFPATNSFMPAVKQLYWSWSSFISVMKQFYTGYGAVSCYLLCSFILAMKQFYTGFETFFTGCEAIIIKWYYQIIESWFCAYFYKTNLDQLFITRAYNRQVYKSRNKKRNRKANDFAIN